MSDSEDAFSDNEEVSKLILYRQFVRNILSRVSFSINFIHVFSMSWMQEIFCNVCDNEYNYLIS